MAGNQTKIPWQQLRDEALTAPGNLAGVYDRFHDYSLTNIFLFMMQGIHEPVAGYARWQSFGRHVVRGAKAKEVIVPVLINERPPDDEPIGEHRARVARLIGFKVVRAAFALADTEGKELAPVEIPDWDEADALAKLGIRQVPFNSTNGNLQGWSCGLEFAVNPTKTMFHEWGHIELGHTPPQVHAEYQTHRRIKEFEAEATAYLCMNELGQLDDETASHGRGYIRHWLDDEQPPEQSIRRVLRAAEAV
jgi:hypothetical protein